MSHSDCQLLFEAGKALVEKSSLARYSGPYFVACEDREGFNEYWKEGFHPTFGRYMAWCCLWLELRTWLRLRACATK